MKEKTMPWLNAKSEMSLFDLKKNNNNIEQDLKNNKKIEKKIKNI